MKKLILSFVILGIIGFFVFRGPEIKTVEVEREVPVEVPVLVHQPQRTPEFRGPPYKTYKPPDYQQIGLLTNQSGQTLPLYGKHSWQYRDRWNYYSTTQGDQIYPLPVTHQNRDCTEDIGCQEFYGGEQVDVFGTQGGPWSTKIYRTKLF